MKTNDMTKNGLTILIHKHMAQASIAASEGDEKRKKTHEAAAQVASAQLNKINLKK